MARIIIINGHPDRDRARLCHALAGAYEEGARANEHQVRRFDVADLRFPLLASKAEFEQGGVPDEIRAAQDAIAWAEHVVIVYPLWLGTMPAKLKGFFEQVFRPGFSFGTGPNGWPVGQLTGKSARIITTMGMPGWVYRWYFWAHSLKSFERHILKFVGIKPVRVTIFGMVEAASEARRAKWLSQVRELGAHAR